jgi:integrase
MSGLVKNRRKYFARISSYNKLSKKQKYTWIPLDTESKTMAKKRQKMVNVNEQLIKDGEITDINNFFPWLNAKGQSKITEMNIGDAINRWIDSRNVRPKTLESYNWSVKHLLNFIPRDYPIANITPQVITDYRKYLEDSLNLSPNSVKINLGTIITLFNWLVGQEFISKMPKISKGTTDVPEVKYLAERDIADLLSSNLSYANKHNNGGKYIRDYEHFKRAFSLYLYTGARMSEAFLGEVRGRWLIIPPNESKSHKKRVIKLTIEQVNIVEEMRERVNNSKNRLWAIRSYSKMFKKTCRIIGLRDDIHLHSLRHTYGCMRRLHTNGNMILVRDEMGHTNLRTTERYSEIPLELLQDDFPELAKSVEIVPLIHQINTPERITK